MSTLAPSPSAGVLELSRRFRASREKVFAAFTTFEAMKKWFGPDTCIVTDGMADFRVGGKYRLVASTPMGVMAVIGEYQEITPPEKLVFTWKWEDDEDWENVHSEVSIELRTVGAETEMRLTHTGFPSEESCGRHTHGWEGCFVKLAALVEA